MNKGELIRALDGLMDETDIIVRVAYSNEVRHILSAHYVKMRADEPACMSLLVSGPTNDAADE